MQKHLAFFNLIPEDESLLSGIEIFIILHEMGHAYIDSIEELVWPFSKKPSPNIRNKMKMMKKLWLIFLQYTYCIIFT